MYLLDSLIDVTIYAGLTDHLAWTLIQAKTESINVIPMILSHNSLVLKPKKIKNKKPQ